MKTDFQIGDRLIYRATNESGKQIGYLSPNWVARIGQACTVTELRAGGHENNVRVKFDGEKGVSISLPECRFTREVVPVDRKKIMATRGGWPAKVLRKKGPEGRPILAVVEMPDRKLELSFTKFGEFISGHKLGVDLVERSDAK